MTTSLAGGRYCIVGIPGKTLDEQTRQLLMHLQPAGVILFGRNIASEGEGPVEARAQQLFNLITDIRSILREPPIITIDQEGGRVSRLKALGAEPPSASQLRDKDDLELMRRHGELTGRLLQLFGFNLDLCPVLDLSVGEDADNSLRGRTWGAAPEQVIANAGVFTKALRAQGILACGKHFPGYSHAAVDPHWELPVVRRSRQQLEAQEWAPYRALLGDLDSVMVGHASYPALDPSNDPASLSAPIIDGVLRRELGFGACVISDDLDMGAIVNRGNFNDSARRAVLAGNDLLLLCHRLPVALEVAQALNDLPASVAERAAHHLAQLRARLPTPPATFSLGEFHAMDQAIAQLRIDTLGAEAATQRSPEDGKRSPVETY